MLGVAGACWYYIDVRVRVLAKSRPLQAHRIWVLVKFQTHVRCATKVESTVGGVWNKLNNPVVFYDGSGRLQGPAENESSVAQ